MTIDAPPLNGHRTDVTAAEHRRYHDRIVNAIERARADLAERVAGSAVDGRTTTVDAFEDRVVAGDAASRELAHIAQFRMEQGLPILPDIIQEELKTQALDSALGLGPLQPYRDNEDLEEIVVNKGGHSFAWWGNGTKSYEGQIFANDDDTIRFAQRVGRDNGRGGQRLDTKHPFMRVDLAGGHRLVAVLGGDGRGGVSTGPLLCLRRKRIAQPTLEGLVTTRMFTERMARQAEALTKGGAGQLIGGGMFSGKTTFLSAELDARWPDERLGTFERDVLELGLFDRWDGFGAPPDIVELYTRAANTEGEGPRRFRRPRRPQPSMAPRPIRTRRDRPRPRRLGDAHRLVRRHLPLDGHDPRRRPHHRARPPRPLLRRPRLPAQRMADQPHDRPNHRRRLVLRDRRHARRPPPTHQLSPRSRQRHRERHRRVVGDLGLRPVHRPLHPDPTVVARPARTPPPTRPQRRRHAPRRWPTMIAAVVGATIGLGLTLIVAGFIHRPVTVTRSRTPPRITPQRLAPVAAGAVVGAAVLLASTWPAAAIGAGTLVGLVVASILGAR